MLQLHCERPDAVQGFATADGSGCEVVLANITAEPRAIELATAGSTAGQAPNALAVMDADTRGTFVEQAMQFTCNGDVKIYLGAYAVAKLFMPAAMCG